MIELFTFTGMIVWAAITTFFVIGFCWLSNKGMELTYEFIAKRWRKS